jgi:hypothetical protein
MIGRDVWRDNEMCVSLIKEKAREEEKGREHQKKWVCGGIRLVINRLSGKYFLLGHKQYITDIKILACLSIIFLFSEK